MPLILEPASGPVVGTLKFEWLDPGGVLRDLTRETSANLFVSRGSAGLGAPGVELVSEKLPSTAGAIHRYTQTKPLEIDLPLSVHAASFASLMATMAELREWFDTGDERRRTPGYLRITRPQDGEERQIACLYAGGLEGDLNEGSPTWAPVVVSLVAPDPYWTDVTPTEAVYDQSDVGVPVAIINSGDFDAYPIWTLAGPGSAWSITNTTTGKSFALTADSGLTLVAGDELTIDTRPAGQRQNLQILSDDGVSMFSKVAAGGALWWLAPGSNTFIIAASGVTADTAIRLQWLPRYRGVLR